jgi:hypothetical protein
MSIASESGRIASTIPASIYTEVVDYTASPIRVGLHR